MADAPGVVAVLGATGRLGRAMARRLMPSHVTAGRQAGRQLSTLRGLARHAPADPAPWSTFVTADRHDVAALGRAIDGSDAVIDLCTFDGHDAEALLHAWRACDRPPRRLVFASALAERPPDQWPTPPEPDAVDRQDAWPGADTSDPYGAGKRAARLRYERGLSRRSTSVITLLLPQVLAPDDPSARESRYLADARAEGAAWVSGSGQQRPCVVTADDVAEILWRCALSGSPAPYGDPVRATFQVAPPTQPPVATLVRALLRGAGLPPTIRAHPDADWRGPHSGADELVDGAALRALLPELAFADLIAAHVALGQWLARSSNQG